MSEKGQSLIEVMIALGVSIIIVTTIVTSVVLAIINAQFAKTQNLATYYAKQGMELLRQNSRADWNTFDSFSGTFCFPKDATGSASLETGECVAEDNFIREVDISREDSLCEIALDNEDEPIFGNKVTVNVYWNDNKCPDDNQFCHDINLDSCFQNINKVSDL